MIVNQYRLKSSAFQRSVKEESREPKKLFILSVEGFHTEKDYFNSLNKYMKEKGKDDVEIHVLGHSNDGLCSLEQVYELLNEAKRIRAEGFLTNILRKKLINDFNFSEQQIQKILNNDETVDKKEKNRFKSIMEQLKIDYEYYQFLENYRSDFDRFVIVIDRDCHSHSKKELNDLLKKCNINNIMFCITNPCFEFWLYLHSIAKDKDIDEEEKTKILKNKIVSDKHTYITRKISEIYHLYKKISYGKFENTFAPNIKLAIENAQKFSQEPCQLLEELGSMVPVLINEIGLPDI